MKLYCLAAFFVTILYPNYSLADGKKELVIWTDFPLEWVKGTWLDEVKRAFFFETGITVRVSTIKAEVDNAVAAGKIMKTDGYSKDRGQLLAQEYFKKSGHSFDLVTEPRITWTSSMSLAALEIGLKFPAAIFWKGNENSSTEFIELAKTESPYRDDDLRHPLIKKYYYNFLDNQKIMALLSPAVLETKEPKMYGYLPNAHLGASTQVMVYNISLLKKIGIDFKQISIPMKEFLAIPKKIHAFNQGKPENEKVIFLRDYDGFLATNHVMSCIESGQFKEEQASFECLFMLLEDVQKTVEFDPTLKSTIPELVIKEPWQGISNSYADFARGRTAFMILESSELFSLKERNYKLFKNLGYLEVPHYEKLGKKVC